MSSAPASQDEHVVAPRVRDILTMERDKIVKMLHDVANLKTISIGQQRSRIQDIEQTLQLALLEVQLELRRAAAGFQRNSVVPSCSIF